MALDMGLLERLRGSGTFSLYLGGSEYILESVNITGTPTHKMKGVVRDISVIPLLTGAMLGPNTDFAELKVVARLPDGTIDVFVHLTGSVQLPDSVELCMTIVRLEA